MTKRDSGALREVPAPTTMDSKLFMRFLPATSCRFTTSRMRQQLGSSRLSRRLFSTVHPALSRTVSTSRAATLSGGFGRTLPLRIAETAAARSARLDWTLDWRRVLRARPGVNAVRLPPDHPLRIELNDEAHARPSEALQAPLRLTFLAIYSDPSRVPRVAARLRARPALRPRAPAASQSLQRRPRSVPPELGAPLEFTRYKFIVGGPSRVRSTPGPAGGAGRLARRHCRAR